MNKKDSGKVQLGRRDFAKAAATLSVAVAAAIQGPFVQKAKAQERVIKYGLIGRTGIRSRETRLDSVRPQTGAAAIAFRTGVRTSCMSE